MNENMKKRNEVLAQTVIKGLESRNMTGYYAADKGEALKLALEIIGEGSSVAMGGVRAHTRLVLWMHCRQEIIITLTVRI